MIFYYKKLIIAKPRINMFSLKIYMNKLKLHLVILAFLLIASILNGQQVYDVQWDPANLVNCTYSPPGSNTLINTGTSTWGSSGAPSLNVIPSGSNGHVYYEIANMSDVHFGLSITPPSSFNPSPNAIAFAFRLEGGNIFIYLNQSMIGYFGGYSTGQRLQIERSGSTILFKINGSVVFNTSYNPAVQLWTWVALKNGGSSVGLMKMTEDVYTPPPPLVPVETIYHPLSNSLDGGIYILPSNSTLRIIYIDKYNSTNELKWKLYSKSSTNPEYAYDDGSSVSLVKNLGDNRIEVVGLSAFLDLNTVYIFEVTGEKGKKQYIKIKR